MTTASKYLLSGTSPVDLCRRILIFCKDMRVFPIYWLRLRTSMKHMWIQQRTMSAYWIECRWSGCTVFSCRAILQYLISRKTQSDSSDSELPERADSKDEDARPHLQPIWWFSSVNFAWCPLLAWAAWQQWMFCLLLCSSFEFNINSILSSQFIIHISAFAWLWKPRMKDCRLERQAAPSKLMPTLLQYSSLL